MCAKRPAPLACGKQKINPCDRYLMRSEYAGKFLRPMEELWIL
jgi:hypothetical protein